MSAGTNEQQAAEIAKMCNEKGISKEQFSQMLNLIKGNKR